MRDNNYEVTIKRCKIAGVPFKAKDASWLSGKLSFDYHGQEGSERFKCTIPGDIAFLEAYSSKFLNVTAHVALERGKVGSMYEGKVFRTLMLDFVKLAEGEEEVNFEPTSEDDTIPF